MVQETTEETAPLSVIKILQHSAQFSLTV